MAEEYYVPTFMAYEGLQNETDCVGRLVHADWSRGGAHPWSYLPKEVKLDLCVTRGLDSARKTVIYASIVCNVINLIVFSFHPGLRIHLVVAPLIVSLIFPVIPEASVPLTQAAHYSGTPGMLPR